jgi:uncharacterized membrane protein YsdA (DUF1294 family)/cold shock CspA family protein
MSARPVSQRGTLSSWDDARGFGFIETSTGRRVFVHISAFESPARRPRVGDQIAFERVAGPDGRPRAQRARLEASVTADGMLRGNRMPGDRPPASPRGRRGRPGVLPLLLVAAFALFLVLAVTIWGASRWYAVLYVGMSAVAFVMYRWDKRAAMRGDWRTSESTLQAAALLGGWPGAVLAQQLLRHKNRKVSFQLVFWLLVIINLGAFVVLVWRSALIEQLSG